MASENNRHIRLALRVVFREDTQWMAQLMSVPIERLTEIVNGVRNATDTDLLLCEMACCEQRKYVERRIDSINRFMSKDIPY